MIYSNAFINSQLNKILLLFLHTRRKHLQVTLCHTQQSQSHSYHWVFPPSSSLAVALTHQATTVSATRQLHWSWRWKLMIAPLTDAHVSSIRPTRCKSMSTVNWFDLTYVHTTLSHTVSHYPLSACKISQTRVTSSQWARTCSKNTRQLLTWILVCLTRKEYTRHNARKQIGKKWTDLMTRQDSHFVSVRVRVIDQISNFTSNLAWLVLHNTVY